MWAAEGLNRRNHGQKGRSIVPSKRLALSLPPWKSFYWPCKMALPLYSYLREKNDSLTLDHRCVLVLRLPERCCRVADRTCAPGNMRCDRLCVMRVVIGFGAARVSQASCAAFALWVFHRILRAVNVSQVLHAGGCFQCAISWSRAEMRKWVFVCPRSLMQVMWAAARNESENPWSEAEIYGAEQKASSIASCEKVVLMNVQDGAATPVTMKSKNTLTVIAGG